MDTEEIFMKSRTLADCTLNTHRVLTDVDIPRNIDETLYSQALYTLGTFLTSPTVLTAIPVPAFGSTSVDGITRVAPGTIHLTKKGFYSFYVQVTLNIQSKLYVQMQVDGVQYDANGTTVPLFTSFDVAGAANFIWSQTTDTAKNITFSLLADSSPTTGTVPNVLAVDIIVHHTNFYYTQ
jgi:hypothetical protein